MDKSLSMSDPNNKHITFVSSSYHELDRRMQRIIGSLAPRYNIKWISRSKMLTRSENVLNYRHDNLNTIFKKNALFYLELNIRIFIKLLFARTDLISVADLDVLAGSFFAARLRAKKLVFDSHEIFHEVPELKGKKFKKSIWKRLSSMLYPRIRYKYTVNNSLSSIFKSLFKTDFNVIRNLPVLSEMNELPSMENKALVYLGAVNIGRGLELAIRALKDLPGYRLEVIGDGDEFEAMKDLSVELGLQERIRFYGYVQADQIGEILSQASIGLNLLDPTSDNYKYSLANKFFDYVHAGLPSVNMRFDEYQILNEEFTVTELVDDYSAESIVLAIAKIESADRYNYLQDMCIRARKVWNWQAESGKLLEIYSEAFT